MDFPTGKELRKEICFDFPSQFNVCLENKSPLTQSESYQIAKEFFDAFFKSSDPSIDVWLTKNKKFLHVGKTSIIFRILNAENLSHFREKSKYPKQDWYSYLWQRMTENFVEKDDYKSFSENKIEFITFNYDRSLEHFLFESLKNAFYGIGTKGAVQELVKREFIHVYGQIALLDWQGSPFNIPYGKNPNEVEPGNIIENLKIIYEARDDPELEKAHVLIRKAKRAFFLGFGYAKENMEILALPEILEGSQRIYGTALGLTEKEKGDVESVFTKVSIRHFHTDLDCLGLLRQYL